MTQTRYNKVSLEELAEAIQDDESIEISNKSEILANEITVIKRDGRKETFNPQKMMNICLWACDDKTWLAEELIKDTEIKLHTEINIRDVFNQLIETAVSKISLLYPHWETIGAKLQLAAIYKDTHSISIESDEYPKMSDVLKKGVEHKIYDKNTVQRFTDEELEEIDKMLNHKRDLLFNYKGLTMFFDKYCLNYSKTKKLELPQHVYMRVALALNVEEKQRMKKIKATYDAISLHQYTKATPIMLNAMTKGQQLSSCVLNTVDDDTHNILDSAKNLGVYSKFKGGTALDISSLRAKGSYINGTQGISSGPVPFLKLYESVMKSFNQGGKRPGALAIYFSWWHLDVFDVLSLKSNGGTDENRARSLKYAVKLNQMFIHAVKHDLDVFLFDPKDVPKLLNTYGEEFEKAYQEYCEKPSIKKRKISARELNEKIFKERSETGNIYLFHSENVNEASLLNEFIGSSNLCSEITLPSRPSKFISEELLTLENGTKKIVKQYSAGQIALCNLSSVNLEKWFYLSNTDRKNLIDTIVRTLDNTVDVANYPVKEGKNSNVMYRYLGIGVLNYANYLALKGIVIDSQQALEETDALFDDLSFKIISASVDLAIEKGKFEKFHETQWAQGVLPIHKANAEAEALTQYTRDENKWKNLSARVKQFGIRNAQLMAIAPTATSGKVINATESIEPIPEYFYKEEGTSNIPTVVTNFKKNNKFYKLAMDCDQHALVRNAAVRQKYLDQSQSVNIYVKRPDSLLKLTDLHYYGFSLGQKCFYYLKQQKSSNDVECESCS